MPHAEMTPHGLATYSEPTFRTYAPQTTREDDGALVVTQLCEELVAGRWEPFTAILSREPAPFGPILLCEPQAGSEHDHAGLAYFLCRACGEDVATFRRRVCPAG